MNEYCINFEDELYEGDLEPIEWNAGEEELIYPKGTDGNEKGADDLSILESIKKIDNTHFQCIAKIKNHENSEFQFIVEKGSRVELAIVTSADCMMGFDISDLMFDVIDVSDNGLKLQVVGCNS